MSRLSIAVAAALCAALTIRRSIGRDRLPRVATHLDGLVVAVMLVFAVAIMDGVTATVAERPMTVALWLLVAFIANPALQVAGALAFSWLGRRRALTVGLVSGNCNMGLLLAAFPPGTDYDVVLYFAVAQLPMYMLPALLAPLYQRLGQAESAPEKPPVSLG